MISCPASTTAPLSLEGRTSSFRPPIFWGLLLAILLVSGVAYASVSLTRPKFNRSEIAYAEISREMAQRGDYIVPVYHGIACVDKPVMNYWVIIPCFKAFGQSGFTARIPSLLASLLCLALTAWAVSVVWDWQTGLLSAAILSTSERYWEFATLCMTDMLLTLFDCVTLILLYVGLKQPRWRFACFAAAAVSMGLAVLTKGPVGLILPAFAFFLQLVLTRQLKILSIKQIAACLAIFFLVAAPWYLAAAHAVNTSASVAAWLWHHNVERFFGSSYEFHHSPTYMMEALFSGFAPWSLFLPLAVFSALKSRRRKSSAQSSHPEQGQAETYLWIWLVLTTSFFTLSRGKMNYYDLPAFPAAAALVALHLREWARKDSPLGKLGVWLLTVVILGGAAVSAWLLPNVTAAADAASWLMMPFALTACGLFAIGALFRRRLLVATGAVCAAIWLTLISFSCQVAPAMARQAPALEYLTMLKSYPDAKIALHTDFANTVDWFDCGFFQVGRALDSLSGTDDLAAYLSQPGKALVILPETRFNQLPANVRAKLTVLERRPYMYEKIDVAFLITRQGMLTGAVPLLLVSNFK